MLNGRDAEERARGAMEGIAGFFLGITLAVFALWMFGAVDFSSDKDSGTGHTPNSLHRGFVTTNTTSTTVAATTTTTTTAVEVAPQAAPGLPEPGSCVILEEEFCDSGTLISVEGTDMVWVGFRLPTGTPVFSLYKGSVGEMWADINGVEESVPTVAVLREQENDRLFMGIFMGVLGAPNYHYAVNGIVPVEEGDLIGVVTDEVIAGFEPYNFVTAILFASGDEDQSRKLAEYGKLFGLTGGSVVELPSATAARDPVA